MTEIGESGRLALLRGAFARMLSGVREDHATTHRYDTKYRANAEPPPPLAPTVIKRIGLQLSAAYRVMRFFDEAEIPLAPQIMSRLIRHAYGADIHWKARLEPGVVVVHGMGMAISQRALVGRGVLIFHNVTIGAGSHPQTRETGAPTIEDDVHIGPGSVIIGPITIGARSKIMANCVVTESVPPDSLVESPSPKVKARARNVGVLPGANQASRRTP